MLIHRINVRYTKIVSRKARLAERKARQALRPKSKVPERSEGFWAETPVKILAGNFDVSEKLVFVYPTIFARVT